MTHAYVNMVDSVENIDDQANSPAGHIMLHLVPVQFSRGNSTLVFCDDGATMSIITHSFAKQLGLVGEDITRWMSFASHEPQLYHTKLYTIKAK